VAWHLLFHIFKTSEVEVSHWAGYSFEFHIHHIYSPTDCRFLGRSYVLTKQEVVQLWSTNYGLTHRYSYIHLLRIIELPIFHGIQLFELHWKGPHRRKLAPQTLIEIATKLPNLQRISGELPDISYQYLALRYECRKNLAHTLESLSLPILLTYLGLSLEHWGPKEQTWESTSLFDRGCNYDSLSSAILNATYYHKNLSTLHVKGLVDASIFWPQNVKNMHVPSLKSVSLMEPLWQNLKIFTVLFDIISPSGRWYFEASTLAEQNNHLIWSRKGESIIVMPPGYNVGEENVDIGSEGGQDGEKYHTGNLGAIVFRLAPDEPVLLPLIESFARACLQIPSLKKATLLRTPQ
jgi:hypothetical protein